MNCPKCGQPVENNTRFCVSCGAAIDMVNLGNYAAQADQSEEEYDEVSYKKPRMFITGMWSWAIIAIITVIITHFVGMAPISDQADRILDQKEAHRYEERNHGWHSESGCTICVAYEEAEANNAQQAAVMWQSTITRCALLALAGAIVYGVGTIAEEVANPNKR